MNFVVVDQFNKYSAFMPEKLMDRIMVQDMIIFITSTNISQFKRVLIEYECLTNF